MPLVSIIVPAYNAASFLMHTVNSVLQQDFTDWELLLIDDSSTDTTWPMLQELEKGDPRIRVFANEQNCGVAATRNRGIELASGNYVAFLDGDDIWEPHKLSRQVALLESTHADLVYSSYDFIDAAGQPVGHAYTVPAQTDFSAMLCENVIGLSTVVVRTELLKKNPFRTDFYHEDYLLWMQLLRAGVKAVGDPAMLAHYRRMPGTRSFNKAHAARERWRIYRHALGLPFLRSLAAFLRYALAGVRKYMG